MLYMLDNNTTNKDAMFPVTEDGYSTIETENAPSAPFTSPPPSFPSASQIHDLPQFNAEAQSLDYLLNDQKYIEQKKLYLQETEVETLSKMLTQLQTTPPVFINHHSIRNILKTYFDAQYLKKLTENHRKMTVKGVFISTVIRFLIISRKEEWQQVTRDNFLEKYPEFENVESKWELLALIRYDRALAVALQYLQGRGNKQLLLSIGAHLEGSNMQYVTGGQPSPGTKRRVQIFERLSGVRPVKRAKRGSSIASTAADGAGGSEVKKVKSNKRGRPPTRHLKLAAAIGALRGNGSEDEDDNEMDDDEDDETSDSEDGGGAVGLKKGASLPAEGGSAKKAKKGTAPFGALDLLSRIASEKFQALTDD